MGICGENICRLCASESSNSVRIFIENDPKRLSSVGEMMLDCILPTVDADSGYPEIVCHLCNLQLSVFYEFKKKALVHHGRFTELIKSHAKNEKIDRLRLVETKSEISETFSRAASPQKSQLGDGDDSSVYEQITAYLKQEHLDEDDANGDQEIEADTIEERLIEEELQDDDELAEEVCNSHKEPIIKCEQPDYLDLEDDNGDDENNQEIDYLESEFGEEQYLDDDDEIDTKTEHLEDTASMRLSPSNIHSEINLDDEDEQNKMEIEMLETISDDELKGSERELMQPPASKRPRRKYEPRSHYPCSHCPQVFEKLADFRKHAFTHKDLKTCELCDVQTYNIEKHLKSHGVPTPESFKCSICGKEFTSALQCEVHEYRHTNVRPFPCTLCDKSFKLKCDLHIHMMCHNDVRKHVCPICGRGFRMMSHLKGHIETHNTENTIECDTCGKLFKTTGSLKSHRLQVHSDSPNYTCDVCAKGFCRKDKMERHRKTHEKKLTKLAVIKIENVD